MSAGPLVTAEGEPTGRWTELLVVATTGRDEQGRNQLRVARIPAKREGILYGEPVSPTVTAW